MIDDDGDTEKHRRRVLFNDNMWMRRLLVVRDCHFPFPYAAPVHHLSTTQFLHATRWTRPHPILTTQYQTPRRLKSEKWPTNVARLWQYFIGTYCAWTSISTLNNFGSRDPTRQTLISPVVLLVDLLESPRLPPRSTVSPSWRKFDCTWWGLKGEDWKIGGQIGNHFTAIPGIDS